jgi:nucleoid-associated protein YgaU
MNQLTGWPRMRQQSDYRFESSSAPDPAEWDVEEEAVHTRILWVRIAALVAFLAAAFIAGFLLAPRESSDARVGDLEARLAQSEENSQQLEAQVADARQQLVDAQAQLEELQAAAAPDPPPNDNPPSREERTRTYTVQPGDTLQEIAVDYYGDVDYDDFLAEFNGIADTTELPVGFDLEIPRKPETP